MSGSFLIRQATEDDLLAVAALEQEVWGEAGASHTMHADRLRNCPEGNVVAVTSDNCICGYTAFCYLDYDSYEASGTWTWYDLSGDGTASTNVFGAPDLFGISLGCAKSAPRQASQALLVEVVKSGVRRKVKRGVLGARLPGYHRYAGIMTAQDYASAEKRTGVPVDPELRYYYAFGMKPRRLVENYFKDPESGNWGMIVEMWTPWWMRVVGATLLRLPLDWSKLVKKYL